MTNMSGNEQPPARLPMSTLDIMPGRVITDCLGIVRGNTVRARHVGDDIMASLRGVVGGEIEEYTKLIGESREQAIDRMMEEAQALGADAIVGVRFMTAAVTARTAEILVYGTAVKLG